MAHTERIYYPINEETARAAHNMMSFRDYTPGSKTAEYRSYVDEAYDIADAAAERRPDEADRIYRLAERFSRRLAENMNKDSAIGTRCPSVMISGAGNFPTRKKEKQVAAWERNHQEWQEIQCIKDKIRQIGRGAEVIRSDDADAIEKMERKLEHLKAQQERMKEANRHIRMKDTEQGNEKLRGMGFSDAEIQELRTPDFCGRIGYADYMLTNNNANIHRIEGRIRSLKSAKEAGTMEKTTGHYKVVENSEIMRIQIIFDGKPEAEVRDILKGEAFRWSPREGAWQRQLTPNGRYAAKRAMEKLDAYYGATEPQEVTA